MKEIIKKYLEEYFNEWITSRGSYPMVPYDEEMESELFFGEVDEDEYIQWEYKENTQQINFKYLEEKYELEIPQELKEYYSSYLFLQLEGFYKDKSVWLNPITDYTNIISELEFVFSNGSKDRIEIGTLIEEDLPICVEVKTGKVIVYDEEKNKYYKLEDSLSDFIKQISSERI